MLHQGSSLVLKISQAGIKCQFTVLPNPLTTTKSDREFIILRYSAPPCWEIGSQSRFY